jgi:uncharacterized membrane protein
VPVFLIIALVGSVLGFLFASVSTYDFVAHLDRQVHGLHCSFLPGIGTPDASGSSGCHLTLMSPYSSVLRDSIWGGIPISLPAMAVFAFLTFWGLLLWLTGRTRDRGATGFYALASLVPALASLVMAIISLRELSAFCKLCVGIYISSLLCFGGAVALWRSAMREAYFELDPLPISTLGIAFVFGCLFVGSSVIAYAASTPNFDGYVGKCGTLKKPEDPQKVLLPLGAQTGTVDVVEVLDPLCPACRGFERRFEKLSQAEHARRRALLFPLDSACNWMVGSAVHPGACAISEAMLCAGEDPERVLSWAFDEQEQIVAAERAKAGGAARLAAARFPELASCIGSSKAKARLNRALRWAVDNQLPVLTPQLYVNGTRLCDADTDLGLDYMLSRLIEQAAEKGR